jgi:hypothetical protein
LRKSFQRGLVCFVGVLHRLPGMLVASEVILLAVMHGGGAVRVRGQLVEFRSSYMRIVGHDGSFFG